MSQGRDPVTAARQASRALRWKTLTASGVVFARPGRLYYARLAGAGALSAVLYDGDAETDPPALGLATAAAGADDWPKVPVSLPFLVGLYAKLTGAGVLTVGFELD